MLKVNTPRQATLVLVIGCIVISASGLIIRNLETANDWQIVFWRGMSLALGIFLALAIKRGRRVFREIAHMGRLEFVGGITLSGALVGYVVSMANTTIANAIFTMSAVPFTTTILTWIFLKERVGGRTVFAIFLAMIGVFLMVRDGMSSGTAFGNMMALLATFCASVYVVVLRKGKDLDMLPALIVAALVSALFAAWMVNGEIRLPLWDLVQCLILGGLLATIGQTAIVISSRHLKGAELTLLTQVQTVLAPLLVWAALDEEPSNLTLIGGLLVLSAILWESLGNRTVFPQSPPPGNRIP